MTSILTAALAFPEWSPALVEIDLGFVGLGTFPLRWYALAYLAGLLIAWRYAIALVKRPALWGGTSPATKDDIDEYIFYVTLGVILGGRIGYILFYQLPFQWESVTRDPMSLLRIWEGGMSFHGGLIGVALAIILVSKARGVKLLSVADIGGVVTPIGLFLGRFANFVNAELYGRHTDAPIGMVFPEGYAGGTPTAYDWDANEWVYTGNEMPRHPSQLYEATLEGLVPAIIIGLLVWRFGALRRPGLCAGLFLLFYGVGRSVAENFRLPDDFASDLPLGLTMGMILSLPMWIGGAWFVGRAVTRPAVGVSASAARAR